MNIPDDIVRELLRYVPEEINNGTIMSPIIRTLTVKERIELLPQVMKNMHQIIKDYDVLSRWRYSNKTVPWMRNPAGEHYPQN